MNPANNPASSTDYSYYSSNSGYGYNDGNEDDDLLPLMINNNYTSYYKISRRHKCIIAALGAILLIGLTLTAFGITGLATKQLPPALYSIGKGGYGAMIGVGLIFSLSSSLLLGGLLKRIQRLRSRMYF